MNAVGSKPLWQLSLKAKNYSHNVVIYRGRVSMRLVVISDRNNFNKDFGQIATWK